MTLFMIEKIMATKAFFSPFTDFVIAILKTF